MLGFGWAGAPVYSTGCVRGRSVAFGTAVTQLVGLDPDLIKI